MSSLIYLNMKIKFDQLKISRSSNTKLFRFFFCTFSKTFMAFDFDFFALIYKRAVLEMSAQSLVESLAETRVHHNLNGVVSLKCVALQCTYFRVPENIHQNIQICMSKIYIAWFEIQYVQFLTKSHPFMTSPFPS